MVDFRDHGNLSCQINESVGVISGVIVNTQSSGTEGSSISEMALSGSACLGKSHSSIVDRLPNGGLWPNPSFSS
jgi:hypothetical protein